MIYIATKVVDISNIFIKFKSLEGEYIGSKIIVRWHLRGIASQIDVVFRGTALEGP